MGKKSIFQNLAPNHEEDFQHTRNGRLPQIDKKHLQKQSKIKPHITIILNGEKLNFFPLDGEQSKSLLSLLLFNIELKVVASVVSK